MFGRVFIWVRGLLGKSWLGCISEIMRNKKFILGGQKLQGVGGLIVGREIG